MPTLHGHVRTRTTDKPSKFKTTKVKVSNVKTTKTQTAHGTKRLTESKHPMPKRPK